jgi:hypothetical protein
MAYPHHAEPRRREHGAGRPGGQGPDFPGWAHRIRLLTPYWSDSDSGSCKAGGLRPGDRLRTATDPACGRTAYGSWTGPDDETALEPQNSGTSRQLIEDGPGPGLDRVSGEFQSHSETGYTGADPSGPGVTR